jgi:alpha,alpha-trehalase
MDYCKGIVKIVEEHWQQPDKGIWELRTEDRHFVFSKLLCWVAIDRAIKLERSLEKGSMMKNGKR